jgi:hypothetical protein
LSKSCGPVEEVGLAIEHCDRSKWGIIEMLVARKN